MKTVASGNWPVKIEQPLPLQLPLLHTPSHHAHLAGPIRAAVYTTGTHRLRDQCVCIRSTREPLTWGKQRSPGGRAERGRLHWMSS